MVSPSPPRRAADDDDLHGNRPWALLVIGHLPELLPADCWQPVVRPIALFWPPGRPSRLLRPGFFQAAAGRAATSSTCWFPPGSSHSTRGYP
ncbi:MAG TPA: hypothetical protein VN961_03095 [Streptosporangiaceae bacterium]|nr:hypothetical protein [Streptosporangiaceae bacterium]